MTLLAREVRCPHCGAIAGYPCKRTTDRHGDSIPVADRVPMVRHPVHVARRLAAAKGRGKPRKVSKH